MAGTVKKVLIVDDDEGVRLFVEAIMIGLGWDCVDARNGEEAVYMAEEEMPDLIILDVQMPVMNGFEAFRRIRNSPFTEDIVIIMLTGVNEESDGIKFDAERMEKEFGVSRPEGFVDKPVDGDFLSKCIMGVVG